MRAVIESEVRRWVTYIGGFGVFLQVRLDRLVLFVELSQVGDEILDDVGMR